MSYRVTRQSNSKSSAELIVIDSEEDDEVIFVNEDGGETLARSESPVSPGFLEHLPSGNEPEVRNLFENVVKIPSESNENPLVIERTFTRSPVDGDDEEPIELPNYNVQFLNKSDESTTLILPEDIDESAIEDDVVPAEPVTPLKPLIKLAPLSKLVSRPGLIGSGEASEGVGKVKQVKKRNPRNSNGSNRLPGKPKSVQKDPVTPLNINESPQKLSTNSNNVPNPAPGVSIKSPQKQSPKKLQSPNKSDLSPLLEKCAVLRKFLPSCSSGQPEIPWIQTLKKTISFILELRKSDCDLDIAEEALIQTNIKLSIDYENLLERSYDLCRDEEVSKSPRNTRYGGNSKDENTPEPNEQPVSDDLNKSVENDKSEVQESPVKTPEECRLLNNLLGDVKESAKTHLLNFDPDVPFKDFLPATLLNWERPKSKTDLLDEIMYLESALTECNSETADIRKVSHRQNVFKYEDLLDMFKKEFNLETIKNDDYPNLNQDIFKEESVSDKIHTHDKQIEKIDTEDAEVNESLADLEPIKPTVFKKVRKSSPSKKESIVESLTDSLNDSSVSNSESPSKIKNKKRIPWNKGLKGISNKKQLNQLNSSSDEIDCETTKSVDNTVIVPNDMLTEDSGKDNVESPSKGSGKKRRFAKKKSATKKSNVKKKNNIKDSIAAKRGSTKENNEEETLSTEDDIPLEIIKQQLKMPVVKLVRENRCSITKTVSDSKPTDNDLISSDEPNKKPRLRKAKFVEGARTTRSFVKKCSEVMDVVDKEMEVFLLKDGKKKQASDEEYSDYCMESNGADKEETRIPTESENNIVEEGSTVDAPPEEAVEPIKIPSKKNVSARRPRRKCIYSVKKRNRKPRSNTTSNNQSVDCNEKLFVDPGNNENGSFDDKTQNEASSGSSEIITSSFSIDSSLFDSMDTENPNILPKESEGSITVSDSTEVSIDGKDDHRLTDRTDKLADLSENLPSLKPPIPDSPMSPDCEETESLTTPLPSDSSSGKPIDIPLDFSVKNISPIPANVPLRSSADSPLNLSNKTETNKRVQATLQISDNSNNVDILKNDVDTDSHPPFANDVKAGFTSDKKIYTDPKDYLKKFNKTDPGANENVPDENKPLETSASLLVPQEKGNSSSQVPAESKETVACSDLEASTVSASDSQKTKVSSDSISSVSDSPQKNFSQLNSELKRSLSSGEVMSKASSLTSGDNEVSRASSSSDPPTSSSDSLPKDSIINRITDILVDLADESEPRSLDFNLERTAAKSCDERTNETLSNNDSCASSVGSTGIQENRVAVSPNIPFCNEESKSSGVPFVSPAGFNTVSNPQGVPQNINLQTAAGCSTLISPHQMHNMQGFSAVSIPNQLAPSMVAPQFPMVNPQQIQNFAQMNMLWSQMQNAQHFAMGNMQPTVPSHQLNFSQNSMESLGMMNRMPMYGAQQPILHNSMQQQFTHSPLYDSSQLQQLQQAGQTIPFDPRTASKSDSQTIANINDPRILRRLSAQSQESNSDGEKQTLSFNQQSSSTVINVRDPRLARKISENCGSNSDSPFSGSVHLNKLISEVISHGNIENFLMSSKSNQMIINQNLDLDEEDLNLNRSDFDDFEDSDDNGDENKQRQSLLRKSIDRLIITNLQDEKCDNRGDDPKSTAVSSYGSAKKDVDSSDESVDETNFTRNRVIRSPPMTRKNKSDNESCDDIDKKATSDRGSRSRTNAIGNVTADRKSKRSTRKDVKYAENTYSEDESMSDTNEQLKLESKSSVNEYLGRANRKKTKRNDGDTKVRCRGHSSDDDYSPMKHEKVKKTKKRIIDSDEDSPSIKIPRDDDSPSRKIDESNGQSMDEKNYDEKSELSDEISDRLKRVSDIRNRKFEGKGKKVISSKKEPQIRQMKFLNELPPTDINKDVVPAGVKRHHDNEVSRGDNFKRKDGSTKSTSQVVHKTITTERIVTKRVSGDPGSPRKSKVCPEKEKNIYVQERITLKVNKRSNLDRKGISFKCDALKEGEMLKVVGGKLVRVNKKVSKNDDELDRERRKMFNCLNSIKIKKKTNTESTTETNPYSVLRDDDKIVAAGKPKYYPNDSVEKNEIDSANSSKGSPLQRPNSPHKKFGDMDEPWLREPPLSNDPAFNETKSPVPPIKFRTDPRRLSREDTSSARSVHQRNSSPLLSPKPPFSPRVQREREENDSVDTGWKSSGGVSHNMELAHKPISDVVKSGVYTHTDIPEGHLKSYGAVQPINKFSGPTSMETERNSDANYPRFPNTDAYRSDEDWKRRGYETSRKSDDIFTRRQTVTTVEKRSRDGGFIARREFRQESFESTRESVSKNEDRSILKMMQRGEIKLWGSSREEERSRPSVQVNSESSHEKWDVDMRDMWTGRPDPRRNQQAAYDNGRRDLPPPEDSRDSFDWRHRPNNCREDRQLRRESLERAPLLQTPPDQRFGDDRNYDPDQRQHRNSRDFYWDHNRRGHDSYGERHRGSPSYRDNNRLGYQDKDYREGSDPYRGHPSNRGRRPQHQPNFYPDGNNRQQSLYQSRPSLQQSKPRNSWF